MPYKVKEIIKIIKEDGWYEIPGRSGTSHLQFKHPTKPGKVTVPIHNGDIAPGTENSIFKQAGLKKPNKKGKK